MKHLFMFLCIVFGVQMSYAQTTISGTVKDGQSSTVIPGVTVALKGKPVSTQTDEAGKFTLEASPTDSITFTFIGYVTRTMPVGDQTFFNISLQSADETLEEVVVVGYGTQRKVDLTGSIAQVKGEAIANMPNANPISSLQGKVAGLTISNSGTPGGSPTVRIRGVNSTNNSNPLYVVDGVLHDNIDFISPQDIESLDVLRDPSSIAIYGLRGANGVIAVTLKKAAQGRTAINFSGSVGFDQVNDRIEVVDAEGFKRLYDMQLVNLGKAPFDYTKYTANTDWQDLILRTAMTTNNNLSISNSTEKSSTHFSLGYNKQEGVVRNGDYERFTARLNQELKVSERVKIGGDISGSYWNMNPTNVTLTNALWSAPIVGVQYDENTFYGMPSFQRAQVGNVMSTLNRLDGTSMPRGYRFVGSLFAEVKIMEGLKWKSTVYTDLGFNNSRGYSPLAARFIYLGENGGEDTFFQDDRVFTSVNQRSEEFRRFQQDHTLTWDKSFNEDHRLTAVGGFTTVFNDNTALEGSRRDTSTNVPPTSDFWYLDIINQDSNPKGSYSGRGSQNTVVGAFARASYAYKNRYLLNATVRRDGSSKFAPKNRWGTFGSVGLGWVLSEEAFFENIEKINFMKLRFAWGKLGNQNGVPDNVYLPGLVNANTAIFGDNIYTSVKADYIPDPNLHWEIVQGMDLGLDIKAFNNKFNAEINLYDRTTKDILTILTLPATDDRYFTNLGEITNRGIEVSMGWNNQMDDFRYGVNANYSYNKNFVNSIGDNVNFRILGNDGANVTETGQSIGYFYGYKQIGIYQTIDDIENMAIQPGSAPGDIAFADIDGDGAITEKDRTYLGTPFPPHNFGINFTVGYKGFDLQLEGNGVAGNKIYAQRRTRNFADLNYEVNRLNAWTGPGSSNVEPILDNSRGNNYKFSSYFLEPGDFFRIRTVQLGYSFNDDLLARTFIRKARLFVNVQNLKTWSKVTGYTPEAAIGSLIAGGTDNGTYPIPTTYSFGVNLSF
ncbi:SusC/RagA family TonB-linked outer membrane protein [Sphingobacterium hotanense]|uniref:SusC/RagA family TonB-linked outer membrane protein n=1 Tax=Sphingobacterium hotanense TaxID=649196 RepID=UPI0021A6921A|nr:TonB-dependent receptor [Sphingobacterium hotanense]MCT1525403.1 TonB-dependent receptor [Sphingobacterium hotanense]